MVLPFLPLNSMYPSLDLLLPAKWLSGRAVNPLNTMWLVGDLIPTLSPFLDSNPLPLPCSASGCGVTNECSVCMYSAVQQHHVWCRG